MRLKRDIMSENNPKRRDVLKKGAVAGAAAVGIGTATGTGSADHSVSAWRFFGCSQVCVDAKGAEAVVATGNGCVKRGMTSHNRGNLDWDHIYCYSVDDNEAIVGIWYDGDFISNDNRCAENYDCPNYENNG